MSARQPTAVIYARVSTSRQASEELPIEGQLDICRRKASELGANVVKEFCEGVSGRDAARRHEFKEAVLYCETLHVDYFIVWNTARFARNKLEAAQFKVALRRRGVKVVYCSNNIDADTDEGWLLEGLFELFDEQVSRTTSKDTRRSMAKNAAEGHWNGGRVPFGYQVVTSGKRRKLEINEMEAPLVREMFSWCYQGVGAKAIAVRLNEQGRLRRGAPWSKNTVQLLLRNEVYAGHLVYNKTDSRTGQARPPQDWIRTTNAHAAIVQEEVFHAVQRMIADRAPVLGSTHPCSTHLFSGMLKCAACGSSMQVETASGRSRRYSYYNCRAALKGTGCRNRRVRTDQIDQWLKEELFRRLLTAPRLRELALEIRELKGRHVKERERQRAACVRELRDAEQRRNKLFEVLELHGKDAPNMSDIALRLRELNAQIRALEETLQQIEYAPAPATDIQDVDIEEMAAIVRAIIDNDKHPQKVREFFATVVERIEVADHHATIWYRPDRIVSPSFDLVHSSGSWLPGLVNLRTIKLCLPDVLQRAA